MRLSKRVASIIISSIKESFGEVDIYLFGSRTKEIEKNKILLT